MTTTVLQIDTCVGAQSGRATFETTTQHVCYAPGGGMFFAYQYTADSYQGTASSWGYWRLKRCPAGQNPTLISNWETVYDSGDDLIKVHHVDIEADENGNIYVFGSHAQTSGTDWWSFAAPNYTTHVHKALGYGSGKFSAIYDQYRKRLCYMLWMGENPNFYVLDLNGNTILTRHLYSATTTSGHAMDAQYPVLSCGPNGLLIAGWVVVDVTLNPTTQNYYSCHFATSTDGGSTWTGKNGAIGLPTNVDATGGGWLIPETADGNEYVSVGSGAYSGNWNFMTDMAYNNGKLNFWYGGGIPTHHRTVATFNYSGGSWAKRQAPNIGNAGNGEGCFSQDGTWTGTLYMHGWRPTSGGNANIQVMTSDDGGLTWTDFDSSTWADATSGLHYMGATRVVDPEGWHMGCFTNGGSIGAGASSSTSQVFVTLTPVAGTTPPPVLAYFPTTGQLDNFNYTLNPLGSGNWTNNAFTAGGLQANGTQALSTQADGTYGGAVWTKTRCKLAPLEVYVDVATIPATAAHRINLYWCNKAAVANDVAFYGYRIGWTNQNGGQAYIDRIEAGVVTTLASPSSLGTLASGDSIGIAVDASARIYVYRQHSGTWTELTSFEDLTPLWTTSPTTPLQYIGVATNDASARFDNFGGGGTVFPSTSVIDGFTYTANPLGGDWTTGVGTFAGLRSDGDYAYAITATGGNNGSAGLRTDKTWSGPPLEMYVDVPVALGTDPNWLALYWASSQPVDGNHSHYRFYYNHSNGGTIGINVTFNGATGNTIFNQVGVGVLAPGDSFGVKVTEGGVLSFYFKQGGTWVAVGSYTDSPPLWDQAINTPLQYIGLGTVDPTVRFDNFGGGGIATVAPSTITIPALVSA